jgi:hypothetical protein
LGAHFAKFLKSRRHQSPRTLENPEHGTVVHDVDCLRITTAKGATLELCWSEVEEVHAYKEDLFNIDRIWLAFKKLGKEEYYKIHEDMMGYHNLLNVLPGYLPEFTSDWFRSVAVPAFARNHRVIWKKSPNHLLQATAAAPTS